MKICIEEYVLSQFRFDEIIVRVFNQISASLEGNVVGISPVEPNVDA
jgi:hypothetical protein